MTGSVQFDKPLAAPLRAVVTGGSRGIGRAISARLGEAGCEVVALSRVRPQAGSPKGANWMRCDVTSETEVQQVFAKLDPIDILINNAGIAASNPLRRITVTEWNRIFAVNTTGTFLCTRAAVDPMINRGFGRIVTIASTAALTGAPYIAAYAASKHAVLGLMRSVAAEVEGTGVTVNTVCPTYVDSDMTNATIANIAGVTGLSLTEAKSRLAETTPHGRIIDAYEVADAVHALVVGNTHGDEVVLDGRPT